MKLNWKDLSLSVLLGTIFIFYSYYVLLHAQLKDKYGDLIIVSLLFLAIPRLWNRREQQGNSQFASLIFWAYMGLAFASICFVVSEFVHPNYFIWTVWRFVLAYFVVIAVSYRADSDVQILRPTLFFCSVLSAAGYILQNYHIDIQSFLVPLAYLPKDAGLWHDKNFALWLVFLMWGAISYYWYHLRYGFFMSFFVFILSTWAVFLSTSESAQLAIVVSGAVFLFSHLHIKRYKYGIYLSGYLSVLILPLIWIGVAPVTPLLPQAMTKIEAIIVRSSMYDCCASLIKKAIVTGYGTGSTTLMRIPDGAIVNWPHNFPGGHPHNLVFLFFLEYGLAGIILLLFGLLLFFHYLFQVLEGRKEAPAVWALIASAWVVFSLSYSVWQADVVLTYAMFFALIGARCSAFPDNQVVSPSAFIVRSGVIGLVILYVIGCGVTC